MSTIAATPRRDGWFNLLLLRADYWRRSAWHRASRLLLIAFYLYLAFALTVYAFQDCLIFLPSTAAQDWKPASPELHAQDVYLTGSDGNTIHGWWCVPPGWTPDRGAILFCHGNGHNLSGRGRAISKLQRATGMAVLIFDYPGFGHSSGHPTEESCYASGEAAYNWLTGPAKVAPDKVVLYGGSLGGAVALDLASRKSCRNVILVGAFTSLPDAAQYRFPMLPARLLVKYRFDNLSQIGSLTVPILIAHSTNDGTVPFAHGERLFAAAPSRKQFFVMEHFWHSDSPNDAFYPVLQCFLAKY